MSENSNRSFSNRIVVLGTGGTIAGSGGTKNSNLEYVAGTVTVSELLGDLEPPTGIQLEGEQISQIDSKDMSYAIWQCLARRVAELLADGNVKGIVITHGTDTIEETAFFLDSVFRLADKPVVLTCAMRPSTARVPDGPQNLADAITVADSSIQGVFVVCAGEMHGAVAVRKSHPYRLNAFDSGDVGPVGVIEEGKIRPFGPFSSPLQSQDHISCVLATNAADWPKIEIVNSYTESSARIINLLVSERASKPGEGVDGLVIAATGNGSIHETLESAALEAESAGIAIRRASRCLNGSIVPTSTARIESAGSLSPVKARIALMLTLLNQRSVNQSI